MMHDVVVYDLLHDFTSDGCNVNWSVIFCFGAIFVTIFESWVTWACLH